MTYEIRTRPASGEFDEKFIDRARPGYFKLRAYRRGPWIPARIRESIPMDPDTGEVLDRSPRLVATIGKTETALESVWLYGREITKDEYEWLTAITELRRSRGIPLGRYTAALTR